MEYMVIGMEKGANLRNSDSDAATLIANLSFSTTLREIGSSPTKWKNVVVSDGKHSGKSGFVSSLNLSPLHSQGAANLVKAAAHYWELFDRGKGKEWDNSPSAGGKSYKDMVLDMWDALKGGRPPGNNTSHPKWPWSAAGMSAFVRMANGNGDYDDFRYSNGHHAFIKHSVRMREEGKKAGPFWGYRLSEYKPRIGDLVVRWRGGVKTYEAVRKIMATSTTFTSHTDVVCEIRSGYLWALGANNSNSVSRVKYLLDDSGFVSLTGDRFMVMKNMVS